MRAWPIVLGVLVLLGAVAPVVPPAPPTHPVDGLLDPKAPPRRDDRPIPRLLEATTTQLKDHLARDRANARETRP